MKITTVKAELDVHLIHAFLSQQSSWAKGISLAVVQKSIENSLCFGGFLEERQIAFARVISDFSTYANLVDVFVLPTERGKGYSKILMKAVVEHPKLQGLRRFTLATADAHGLYRQFGFRSLAKPESFVERYDPEIYA
ncbi:MAG: GNAT family N-acetyltransferase [Pseudomonadales bacterium]|nr:GNAT family N-acetyltransferase [Pseudomonadales bacterium]